MKIYDEIQKAQLGVMFSGHGHYKVSGLVYGKHCSFITSDMPTIDDYKDDDDRRWKPAAKSLLSQLRNHYRSTMVERKFN